MINHRTRIGLLFIASNSPGEDIRLWKSDTFRSGQLIRDQSDGLAHRDFIERVAASLEAEMKIITLTLNADGVKIFADTKNKKSVWPFYLAINEVRKEQR